MKSGFRNAWVELSFAAPALILFLIIVVWPFVSSFYYALTQWDGFSKPVFIGFDNFVNLFKEPGFRIALRNTLLFALAGLFLSNALSLALALALNRAGRSQTVLRTIFYLPGVVSFVTMSIVWTMIYHNDGALNQLLRSIGLGSAGREWLGTYDSVMPALIVIMVWGGVGFGVIVFLAGLSSIPAELYEAANLDGAGPLSVFRYITFPLLMPSITVVTFLGLTTTLRMFDLPFIMTNGGPGDASNTISLIIYKHAFSYSNYGYATAGGIILFLFVGIVSLLQLRLTRSKEVQI
ncbi:carbohydrate ABC transporter permease [Cohnella hashimotonis]|uniref:Sugar ABC transporter permease n=1 Tax=Cohnella hashimotonis TaxID=2826895 RepID=A0ABT6TCR2_9BACL|nr:sugar ABC transporter permease [Cohnella hashimotonis]MDI4644465.1 sugar ABC transporter permease [Cohnella hashimotonis]